MSAPREADRRADPERDRPTLPPAAPDEGARAFEAAIETLGEERARIRNIGVAMGAEVTL